MRPIGTAAELQRRRIRAVELVNEGESPEDVAHFLGCGRSSVYTWVKPDERVWQHVKHGRLSNLTPHDTAELRAELVEELERLARRPELLAPMIRHARIPIRVRT